ncbi:MAG: hypothetical protein AAFU54_26205 [Chloroflexota bacterium]
MSIRLIVAASADLLLLGAMNTLSQHPGLHVIQQCSDFQSLLTGVQSARIDVILIGDTLDPELDLWTQISQLRQSKPCSRLILITDRISGLMIRELLDHGLTGILCQHDELTQHLSTAVIAAAKGTPYLSPTVNAEYLVTMQSAHAAQRLDPEARQVLNLLAHGKHAGQIGRDLGIDKRRVYWVREKLRRRFGAKTNEHLIQRAAAEGFIYPRD